MAATEGWGLRGWGAVEEASEPDEGRVRGETTLGELAEAQKSCRQAIRLTPRSSPPGQRAKMHNDYGYTLAAEAKHEEAIEQYETALFLDPSLNRARNNMAFSLAALGRDEEAQEHFSVALAPSYGFDEAMLDANVWGNLGLAQQARGDVDAAQASYMNALSAVPDHPRAVDALAALKELP